MAVGKGLTRLSTSSPCSTSLRTCDTIRCLAASRSCCLALASRTQAWYSATASCTWGNQGPSTCGTECGAGCTRALGGMGLGPHLGLGLLSRSPPPLLLFAGPRRGLGCRVLGGCLGANPQVLTALYILELGPPQRLHCLILGPWGWGQEQKGTDQSFFLSSTSPALAHPPTPPGLTIRFCSLIHCSLNSFRHFSISFRLAARGWQGGQIGGLPQGSPPSFRSPLPRAFHPLGPLPGLHSPPPTGSPPHPF